MRDVRMAIEEIAVPGSISLTGRSARTLQRWCKDINERLAAENYDWRVQANKEDMTIEVIDKLYAEEG